MPIPIIEATHRGALFRRLGTFWTALFKDRRHLRILLAMGRLTTSLQKLESVLNNLAGYYQDAHVVSYVKMSFQDSDVLETGMMYYDDPLEETNYVGERVYNVQRVAYYALRLKATLPLAIQTPKGHLILGSDFFVQANEYVLFRQDPRTLFPTREILVSKGIDRTFQPLANFYLKTETSEDQEYLVTYYRRFQTPEYFRLALAAEAGLKVLKEAQTLLEIRSNVRETVYVFERDTVRVDYYHAPLVVGMRYPRHYVIGEGVRVYQSGVDGAAWWRQVNWRGGLSLDPFIPFRGLSLVDKESIAFSAGSDTGSLAGSKLHTRVLLDGPPDIENAYWEEVARKETEQKRYLNAIVRLPEDTPGADATLNDTYARTIANTESANVVNVILGLPPEAPDFRAVANQKLVNPLDVFFQSVLGKRGFVVLIDQAQIKNLDAVFQFAMREAPIGCTPIIFSYIANLPVETITLNTNILAHELVDIQNTIPLDVTESISLNSVVREYVDITQELPA